MSRIIFMGTPEFAVPVLDAFTHTPHQVVGVFTRQDKPAGRGGQLQASPVKQLAQMRHLPIYQPRTLRSPESIALIRDLNPNLVIVSAYGLILPRAVLTIPKFGCVNTHASLLPRHRGAAPIAAAILAGDRESGVTLMQMDEGVDTGPILAQRAIQIEDHDTTGTLTTKLAQVAGELLIENLSRILEQVIEPRAQDESHASYANKIEKEQGLIDWSLPAEEIARRIRAFNPWPSAYTFWNGAMLKIHQAEPINVDSSAEPGKVVEREKATLVACGTGTLALREVQLAGKRAMEIEEFVRGQRNLVGAVFENAEKRNLAPT